MTNATEASAVPIFQREVGEEPENLYEMCRRPHKLILPNSRKADTMSYEFIAINRNTPHERAIVQVKTGETPLHREVYANVNERVFLFQANGIYRGEDSSKVECLKPEDIENFIRANIQVMPGAVQKWVKYLDEKGVR